MAHHIHIFEHRRNAQCILRQLFRGGKGRAFVKIDLLFRSTDKKRPIGRLPERAGRQSHNLWHALTHQHLPAFAGAPAR